MVGADVVVVVILGLLKGNAEFMWVGAGWGGVGVNPKLG